MEKNDRSNRPKWSKFWHKISILEVYYRPFEVKILPKADLLRSKTNPKHFLNNSKTTSKKSERLFWPSKWLKITPQNRQNELNFNRNILFSGSFYQALDLKKHPKVGLIKAETMPKHFPNKSKKTSKSPENDFLTPKMAKSRVPNWPKVSIFGSIFAVRALFFASWFWKKN